MWCCAERGQSAFGGSVHCGPKMRFRRMRCVHLHPTACLPCRRVSAVESAPGWCDPARQLAWCQLLAVVTTMADFTADNPTGHTCNTLDAASCQPKPSVPGAVLTCASTAASVNHVDSAGIGTAFGYWTYPGCKGQAVDSHRRFRPQLSGMKRAMHLRVRL